MATLICDWHENTGFLFTTVISRSGSTFSLHSIPVLQKSSLQLAADISVGSTF